VTPSAQIDAPIPLDENELLCIGLNPHPPAKPNPKAVAHEVPAPAPLHVVPGEGRDPSRIPKDHVGIDPDGSCQAKRPASSSAAGHQSKKPQRRSVVMP
jgi:hypothetical protein